MKREKKLITILVIPFLLCLTGCLASNKDSNGPNDYSLTTMTEDDIIENKRPVLEMGAIRKSINNKTSISVMKFYGIKVLEKIRPNGTDINLVIEPEVKKGNLAVVICTENTIVQEIPVNCGEQKITIPYRDEPIFLKVAGESAKYNLSYEFENYDSDKEADNAPDNKSNGKFDYNQKNVII